MMSTLTIAAVYLSSVAALSILVKSTLFLALGLAAVWLTRRARASVRHLLLAATFATLVVLPFLVFLGPAVSIEMPIAARPVLQAASVAGGSASPLATSFPVGAGEQGLSAGLSLALGRLGQTSGLLSWLAGLSWLSWPAVALWVWFGGAALLTLATVIDLWRIRCVVRHGLPWIALQQQATALAAQARLPRAVNVLRHEQVSAPFMCGFWRPTIVLPAAATAWDEEDLTRGLIHELEHVRRRDWVVQCVARLTCSWYWFHPLVWIAWRRLSLEAERACDDAVVQRMEGTGYAEQLVVMAQRLSRAAAPAVLGMANRSDLASRVTAILDGMQRRGRAGTAAVATVMSAAVLIGAAIAPVRAVAPAPAPAPTLTPTPTLMPARGDGPAEPPRNNVNSVNAERSTRIDTALYEAAKDGDVSTITALLDAGANVNAVLLGDGSPLIGAAREGHLPAVRLLLDRGADVNLGVRGDGNPLIMAAREGLIETVTLLLDRGANVDQVVPGDENALIQASDRGHLEVVKLLVARGADVNARVWAPQTPTTGEWRSPLRLARAHRHTAVVEFLRSAGARE